MDDPKALMQAIQRDGVELAARVDRDGLGGYSWSAYAFKLAGDSILHLGARWKKRRAIGGLYPLGERDPCYFDLTLTDANGQTAENACFEAFGLPIRELWVKTREGDIRQAVETAKRLVE